MLIHHYNTCYHISIRKNDGNFYSLFAYYWSFGKIYDHGFKTNHTEFCAKIVATQIDLMERKGGKKKN